VSIHSEERLRILKQLLNGGEWVQQIMKNGLYPAFKQEPGRYRELNNRSARQSLKVEREKMEEWMEQ
jgi:hypothetical protein